MTKEKFKLPNFDNVTFAGLIDMLAITKREESQAKRMSEVLKQRIHALRPKDQRELVGDKYRAIVSEMSRAGGLDEAALKKDFGIETIEKYRKPSTEYSEIRTYEKDEEEAK